MTSKHTDLENCSRKEGWNLMKNRESIMTRLAHFIVDARWVFLLLFVAMAAFSAFSFRWVHVEEDVAAYLPEEAEARIGLEIGRAHV